MYVARRASDLGWVRVCQTVIRVLVCRNLQRLMYMDMYNPDVIRPGVDASRKTRSNYKSLWCIQQHRKSVQVQPGNKISIRAPNVNKQREYQ